MTEALSHANIVAMAVTIHGVCVVTFMMAMYAFEAKGRHFVAAFVLGRTLSG